LLSLLCADTVIDLSQHHCVYCPAAAAAVGPRTCDGVQGAANDQKYVYKETACKGATQG